MEKSEILVNIPMLKLKLTTKPLRFFLIFFLFIIPISIHIKAGNIDEAVWWLCFAVVSGLIPFVIVAYLLFPALEGRERTYKVIEKVRNWISEWREGIKQNDYNKEEIKKIQDIIEVADGMVASTEDRIEYYYGIKNYVFPLTFLGFVAVVGFFLVFSKVFPLYKFQEIDELILDIPISVLIGFTGGWFYSLYSIVNRYRTGDIPPGLIIQLAYQMLFSGIVAYFATTLSPEITDQVVAFCVGFIPYADLATYLRVTGSARLGISGAKTPKEVEADTSLRTFEWMSSKDIARLEEEEIQTIEHLAMANPISLYLVTSYQMSQIVEWINIAYLRRLIDQDIANKLKPMGILGAIGVSRVQANSNQNFIKSLAEAFGKKQPHINNLVQTLATDPKVSFLNKLWDEFSGT